MIIYTKHSGYHAGIRLYPGGGKGGSSAPPPDPRLIAAQIKSMGIQDTAIQAMMENSASMAPLQKQQMQFGLDSAKTAYGQAQEDRTWALGRREDASGLQDTMVKEAQDYNSLANQDKLALVLLKRRGLDKYLAGVISADDFANSLAREWASLPLVSGPKKGRSAYAGDGLNKSHVSVDAFMGAVHAVKSAPALSPNPVADSRPADPVTKSPWAALLAFIVSLFRKGA